MKTLTRIGLVFCLYLFFALAFVAQGQAEDFFIYKDPQGNLVISNKPPPPGSSVLKKHDLPETPGPELSQPKEGADPQPNERSDSSPQPPKSK